MAVPNTFLACRETGALSRRVSQLRRERDRLSAQVSGMESSLSWRISAPLRWMDSARRQFAARCHHHTPLRQSDGFAWIEWLTLQKSGPQLAFDVSRVVQSDFGTGIQRVVRNVARELVSSFGDSAIALDFRHGCLADVSGNFGSQHPSAEPQEIDRFQRLLMLDGSWDIHREIAPLWAGCHAAGIPVVTCLYDLIPIDYADSTKGDLPTEFRGWLESSARNSDAFVCISEATARRLETFLRNDFAGPRRARKIGWWRLGSDLETAPSVEGAGHFLVPPGPYVLCVGTFEPRKNQDFLLEAFSRRWREENYPVSLVFAGRDGWKTEDLIRRIEEHPEFGRRLWWFRGVEDAHLQELYRLSSAVIMASSAEGFGLPIVEGARFHKPIVLTDIPVFREIVEESGYFFAVNDADSLRQAVDRALAADALPTNVREVTWRQSAQELYDLIVEEKYQITL